MKNVSFSPGILTPWFDGTIIYPLRGFAPIISCHAADVPVGGFPLAGQLELGLVNLRHGSSQLLPQLEAQGRLIG